MASTGASHKLEYSLAAPGIVEIALYSISGKQIALLENSYKDAGQYSANLGNLNLGTGQYLIRFRSSSLTKTTSFYFMR
ncbi:MAG: T9SS type A sorting domain-containing protein [Chitinivibrionales bacterium]|nr:T9SS type A sorting domain-containing protein [Chitinivibrionales bacterium]